MGRKPTGRPNGRPRSRKPEDPGYSSAFKVSRESVLAWYEKYYDSIAEDDENPVRPPADVQKKIRKHFEDRPFDKLRWGLLKIISKEGELVYFDLNEEQCVLQTELEDDYYNKRPVRWENLKARQIGLSTYCQGVTYCFSSTQSYKNTNVVADLVEKCEHQLDIFNTFWENEPDWVRPEKSKETRPLTFDDKAKGMAKTRVRFESAERRTRIGRSFTNQCSHNTEVAFWPADMKATIINSLMKTVPDSHPSIVMNESTGNDIGDVFYNRYMAAKRGRLGAFKAFFFPVQMHSAYKKELPTGVTPEEFFELLSPADQERMQTYDVSHEFMHWYTTQRDQEMLEDNVTELLFCREYPMSEEEAFLGANSNFFDPIRCKKDIGRTLKENCRIVRLAELPESSSFLVPEHGDGKIRYAKCHLQTDWESRYLHPQLIDQEDITGRDCLWKVWERPRIGHSYIIAADPSTGRLAVKNVKTSRDNAALGVWRITYDDRERPCFVQVAQMAAMGIGPKELAREAMAMSLMYVPMPNQQDKALIIAEGNAHGASFIDTAVDDGAHLYRQRKLGQYNVVIEELIGFHTTGGQNGAGSKMVIYANLRQAWNQDMLVINSTLTAQEFGVFAENDGKLAAIPPNHDDTVTEAALFIEGVKFLNGSIAPKRIERTVKSDGGGYYDDWDDVPESPKIKRKSLCRGELVEVGGGELNGWGIS